MHETTFPAQKSQILRNANTNALCAISSIRCGIGGFSAMNARSWSKYASTSPSKSQVSPWRTARMAAVSSKRGGIDAPVMSLSYGYNATESNLTGNREFFSGGWRLEMLKSCAAKPDPRSSISSPSALPLAFPVFGYLPLFFVIQPKPLCKAEAISKNFCLALQNENAFEYIFVREKTLKTFNEP